LLSLSITLDPDIALNRRTQLSAVPASQGSESGETFKRKHFAETRDALFRFEEHHPFEPGALYCFPDMMHPQSHAVEILSEENPASPTRFGACTPPAPESYATSVTYPLLGLQEGVQEVFETQREWLDWLAIRRQEGWSSFALLDAPPDTDAQGFMAWRRGLSADYAALYAPWLEVAPFSEDREWGLLLLPPSIRAAATAAVVEKEIGPHGAPAHRVARGVAGLYEQGRLPGPGFLHEERINVVRATEVGLCLLGSRTTSFEPEWTHINVRRLVDWIRRQLALDSRWAVFEPNHDALRTRLRQSVERRLRLLFERGAFAGRTLEESFFVRTRGDRADFGELILEIGVAPSVPMEFIVFELIPPAPEGSPLEDSFA
jgi:hypothetical protein